MMEAAREENDPTIGKRRTGQSARCYTELEELTIASGREHIDVYFSWWSGVFQILFTIWAGRQARTCCKTQMWCHVKPKTG